MPTLATAHRCSTREQARITQVQSQCGPPVPGMAWGGPFMSTPASIASRSFAEATAMLATVDAP